MNNLLRAIQKTYIACLGILLQTVFFYSCGTNELSGQRVVSTSDTINLISNEEYNREQIKHIAKKRFLDSAIRADETGKLYHERGEVNLLLLSLDSSIFDFKRSIKHNYKVRRSNRIISDIFRLQGMEDSSKMYRLR